LKGDRVFNRKPSLSNEVEKQQLVLLSEMEGLDSNSDEYNEKLEQIHKLGDIKVKKMPLSKDAVLGAVASIAGILLVLNYERTGAIVSKSFGMVRKP
jgi:hypothetical protein